MASRSDTMKGGGREVKGVGSVADHAGSLKEPSVHRMDVT